MVNKKKVSSHKYSDRSPNCKFSIILIHILILTWFSNQAHVNLHIVLHRIASVPNRLGVE